MEVVDKKKLPYVYTADELTAMFLAVYSREEARGSVAEPAFVKQKRLEIKKIVASGKSLSSTLREMALAMPFLDKLHPFYRDLIDVLFGVQNYKHVVAKVGNAYLAVRAIAKEAITAARSAPNRKALRDVGKMYRARVIDLIEDLRPELERLREIVTWMRRLPSIDPELFTIVVAGAPNVGKSSFVKCVSSAKPEVAEYPFTTKQIHLGHVDLVGDRVQVVDTPGLLDRPLSERNAIERQAILALRHLANVIVFIIDPTPHSGFGRDIQIKLYEEIKSTFSTPVVSIVNKTDIATEEELQWAGERFSPVAYVSTLNCSGTKEALDKILKEFYVPVAIEKFRRLRSGG
ncbi:MAG: NOG1 family protein [Pyrobaculum sp.]